MIDDSVQALHELILDVGECALSLVAEAAEIPYPRARQVGRPKAQQDTLKFAEAAIADSKREGLLLAVRARWVALAVIAVALPIINPNWDVIYYVVMLGLFALIGWAQLKVGKVGRSQPELFLIFCDLALITLLTVVPNPLSAENWPIGMQFRFGTFIYFFVFLATATLAYSWRTVVAMGFWTAAVWAIGIGWACLQPATHAELSERVRAAVGSDVRMFDIINPSSIGIPERFQEIIVFLIVAMTLALAVRRSNALLISHAGIERERTNLARYFSPNVVEQLSGNDEPLKRVRHPERCGAVCRHRGFHRLYGWPETRWRSSAHCDNSTSGWNGKCSGTAERWTNILATD